MRGLLKKGVIALLVIPLLFMLSGCVEYDQIKTPSWNQATGETTFSTLVETGDYSPQTLTQYGLFYSTNRSDIVAVTGTSFTISLLDDEDFYLASSVQTATVDAGNTPIEAMQKGTLSVKIPNLKKNTTYYYRFFTVGTDPDEMVWKHALTVGSYTTPNNNAYLNAIKTKYGRLSPSFVKSRMTYTITIPAKYSSTVVTAVKNNSRQTLKTVVSGSTWSTNPSRTVRLAKGQTKTFRVNVKSSDGTTAKSYAVKVTRKRW